MKFLVAVEYGYYEDDDVYHGPISTKVTVDAADESMAEAEAWRIIKKSLGRDMLSGEKVCSITQ